MHAPHHEGRARPLSLCLDQYTESMASFDTFLSEADRMAQGACDGAGTTGPNYVSSGDFIGTGPDSARHIINYCNYSYFSFPPYEVLTTWS